MMFYKCVFVCVCQPIHRHPSHTSAASRRCRLVFSHRQRALGTSPPLSLQYNKFVFRWSDFSEDFFLSDRSRNRINNNPAKRKL